LGSGGLCGGGRSGGCRSGGGLCGGGFGVEDCGGENGGSWTTIGGPDETTRLIRVSGEITAFGCGDWATTVPLGRPDGVLDTIGASRRANCRNSSWASSSERPRTSGMRSDGGGRWTSAAAAWGGGGPTRL
jgi:hypothetical protein